MTKKKRNHPDVDEILARPWCYYCERDFDDLKILINHQKAKHFKCERCGRRLNTAGGLSVHMSQVHKENLTAVDNALPNRVGLEIEIFGMEGIPEDIVQQHNQRVLTQFHQAEAERRAATGNNGPGAQNGNPGKKPKTEDLSDLKKRLAEHKAAKLAADGGGSSGSATPTGAGQTQNPPQQPAAYQAGSPFSQHQQTYAPPPASTTTYGQPQTYSPAVPAQQPYPAPGYVPPAAPGYGQPFPQPPYVQPPPIMFQQQQQQPPVPFNPQFSPPPFQGQVAYPPQPFPPPNGAAPFPSAQLVGSPAGHPPRPFGTASPVSPFPPQQQRTQSPAQNGLPQRTGSGSLPSAPGLPQRPAVGAPPVNAFQFQQMHQGQIPGQPGHVVPQPQYSSGPPGLPNSGSSHVPEAPIAASINDLISSASKQADANAAAAAATALQSGTPQPAAPTPPATSVVPKEEPAAEEKTGKKEKEKAKQTRLVYSDNETSPEEKMAMMPKYTFTRQAAAV